MNMLFQPLLMECTRERTMSERQRMMSSRIAGARDWRMTTTKGFRKSLWKEYAASSLRSRNFMQI